MSTNSVELDRFFALRHVAAKAPGRYSIHGVQVRPDGSVAATDGRMFFVADGTESREDVEGAAPIKPVVVSADGMKSAKSLYKRTPKGNGALHFNGKVTMRDGWQRQEVTMPELDGEFPDLDAVTPRDETAFKVTLSASLIEQVCKLAKEVSNDMPTFTLEFSKENMIGGMCKTAIRVVVNEHVRGAIMPVNC